jgi:hypothetical protein
VSGEVKSHEDSIDLLVNRIFISLFGKGHLKGVGKELHD